MRRGVGNERRAEGLKALGEAAQRIAGDGLRRLLAPTCRQLLGIREQRLDDRPPGTVGVLVLRGIDLPHARIDRRPDPKRGRTRPRLLGDREQAVDGQHRLAGTEGESLRHRAGRAQAGERAGPAAEGDGVEVREAQAGVAQKAEEGRQQRRRGLGAAFAFVRPDRPEPALHGDGHPLRRGVERDQRGHDRQGEKAVDARGIGRV